MLQELAMKAPIEIAAYCVMGNHVHILAEGDLSELSHVIRRLNLSYAIYYNSKKERVGHVFQDRFKSQMITDEEYLLRCLRYIHNNPVKAQAVTSPEQYRHSSFQEYFSPKSILNSRQADRILEYFDHNLHTFREFHAGQDDDEYLEIPEQIQEEMVNRGMKIIGQYIKNEKLTEVGELKANPRVLEKVVVELHTHTNMSNHRIGQLLGVSEYYVRKTVLR